MRYNYKKAVKAQDMSERLSASKDLYEQVSRVVSNNVDVYELIKQGEVYLIEHMGYGNAHVIIFNVTRYKIKANFDGVNILCNTQKDIFESKLDTHVLRAIAIMIKRRL